METSGTNDFLHSKWWASLLSETMNLIEPKQCMNNQESKSPLRNYKLWLNPNSAWTTRRASLLCFWEETCSPGCSCTVWVQSKFIVSERRLALLVVHALFGFSQVHSFWEETCSTTNFDWTQTVHEQPGEQVSSQKLWTLIEPKQCMNNQESKSPLRNYELDWTQTVHEQPGEQVSSQKLRTLIEPKQCMNNQESKSPD
jgi:hypothetical protein